MRLVFVVKMASSSVHRATFFILFLRRYKHDITVGDRIINWARPVPHQIRHNLGQYNSGDETNTTAGYLPLAGEEYNERYHGISSRYRDYDK